MENSIFQNAVKWSKFNLKSWFAYPQTPHKNLIKMAKYVFWFNKYRDVQRRKCVFNLRGHNTQRGLKWPDIFLYIFFKICLNLLTPVSMALLLLGHCWTSVDCLNTFYAFPMGEENVCTITYNEKKTKKYIFNASLTW